MEEQSIQKEKRERKELQEWKEGHAMNQVTDSRDGVMINTHMNKKRNIHTHTHTIAFFIQFIGKQTQITEAFQLWQHKSDKIKG